MQSALNNSLHVTNIQKYSGMIYCHFIFPHHWASVREYLISLKKKEKEIPTCPVAMLEVVEVGLANRSCSMSAQRPRITGTSIPSIWHV